MCSTGTSGEGARRSGCTADKVLIAPRACPRAHETREGGSPCGEFCRGCGELQDMVGVAGPRWQYEREREGPSSANIGAGVDQHRGRGRPRLEFWRCPPS